MILLNSSMCTNENDVPHLYFQVRTNMFLHILNSSNDCFGSKGTRTITEKAYFGSSVFWIWHATEQDNWFRDIIWNYMSVTMYWRSSPVILIIVCLISCKKADCRHFACSSEHLFNYFLSLEQSTYEFSLWLDATSPDDEWCRHQSSSGNDGVRTQYESRKRNADKGFNFFGITSANVTKHAYECLKCFLSLNILRERSWRYWRTYVSISFLNDCWDIADFWWVFRIQVHEELIRETCRYGQFLSIVWARYNDASCSHECSSRSSDEERSSWVRPK